MSLESDLVARLRAVPGVTDLVASRIYPALLPQSPTYPALVWQLVGGGEETAIDGAGPTGAGEARFQLTCWAETAIGAIALAAAVTAALTGAPAFAGHRVGIALENALDSLDEEVGVRGRILEFSVTHAAR